MYRATCLFQAKLIEDADVTKRNMRYIIRYLETFCTYSAQLNYGLRIVSDVFFVIFLVPDDQVPNYEQLKLVNVSEASY